MKYLRCDTCGHPNPMKSEYLTFCDACGKKLPLAFAEWRKLHPMASFEEYIRQVGFSPKNIPETFTGRLKKSIRPASRRKVIWFLAVFAVLIAVTGTLFGKKAVYTLMYPRVPASYLYRNWQHVTIGRQALEINTPVKLWIHDQPLDPEDAKVTEYAKTYKNEDGSGIQITVNMHSFQPNVANTLEEAIAAAHINLQLRETAADINCKAVPVLISGIQGMLEEGNYLYRGSIKLSFCNLVMTKERHRWQIFISYRDDDPVGHQVAQRILKSVKIK